MCGDLEEEGGAFESELLARFLVHARMLLRQRRPETQGSGEPDLGAYMDRLFMDALARCIRDTGGAQGPEGAQDAQGTDDRSYELLSVQPVVFARLAGFLAAHVSLQEDPLRKVMEALMHGYAEAETMRPHDHDHDHHHGHDHGHGHGHDHHH